MNICLFQNLNGFNATLDNHEKPNTSITSVHALRCLDLIQSEERALLRPNDMKNK
jgi:hypothetical protein